MICPHCHKAVVFRISDELKQTILSLSEQGYSSRDIAALTSVSFSSVYRIINAQPVRKRKKKKKKGAK